MKKLTALLLALLLTLSLCAVFAAAADDGRFGGYDKYYLNMMQAWYFAPAGSRSSL